MSKPIESGRELAPDDDFTSSPLTVEALPPDAFAKRDQVVVQPDPAGPDDRIGIRAIAATERRIADARRRLDERFGDVCSPASVPVDGRVADVGEVWTVAEVINAVDDVLVFEDMRPPRLALDLTGAPSGTTDVVEMRLGFDVLRPDVPGLSSLLESQGALVLRSLDGYVPSFGRIAADVETVWGRPADVDVVLLGPGSRRRFAQGAPGFHHLCVVDGEVTVESDRGTATVATGQATAVTTTDGSVTISSHGGAIVVDLTVSTPTMQALAIGVSPLAQLHPLFRADVPPDPWGEVHSYGGSLFDGHTGFLDTVRGLLSPQHLRLADVARRARLVARPHHTYGAVTAWLSSTLQGSVRVCVHGGAHPVSLEEPAMAGGGSVVRSADVGLMSFLADHSDGQAFSLASAPVGDAETLRTIARQLVSCDWIEVLP